MPTESPVAARCPEPPPSATPPGRRRSIVFITRTVLAGSNTQYLIDLVTRLDAEEFDTSIVCLGTNPYSERLAAIRPQVRVCEWSSVGLWAFWRELRALKPDVAALNGYQTLFSIPTLLAVKFCGARRVAAIEHVILEPAPDARSSNPLVNLWRRCFGFRRRQRVVMRMRSRLLDCVICVSEAVRQNLIASYGYRPEKTCVVTNGINLAAYSNPDAGRGSNAGPPTILCLARLSEEKGIDILLQTLAELKRQGVGFRCSIAGRGPLEAAYRELAKQLGVEKQVEFLGWVEDVRPLLYGADVLVVPSRSEAISLAAMEGMAAGLPVVATRVGGIPEIVRDGENGILTAPDAQELARPIAALLNDAAARHALGAAARLAASEFDVERTMRRVAAALAGQVN